MSLAEIIVESVALSGGCDRWVFRALEAFIIKRQQSAAVDLPARIFAFRATARLSVISFPRHVGRREDGHSRPDGTAAKL